MQITVLGKTFNTEEERRNFFREELRKKLPELKQIVGFPIGEDEDILNLSDPPYYTACPNPWLNDLIDEWEEEKRNIEIDGNRSVNFEIDEPYTSDVSEGKNNPVYMAHSYHTKVPHPAIMRYILHYTQPGDIILDGFAGTCMTGVAGAYCKTPDIKSNTLFKNELNNPIFGNRKVICSDLSPIATSIGYSINCSTDSLTFKNEAESLISELEEEYSWLYSTKNHNGVDCKVDYFIWEEKFNCPSCNSDISYWSQSVSSERDKQFNEFKCPNCSQLLSKKNLLKSYVTDFDPFLKETLKRVNFGIALICYSYNKRKYFKKPDESDLQKFEKLTELIQDNNISINTFQIPLGDKTSEPHRLGLHYTHQLFTYRNAFILDQVKKRLFEKGNRYIGLFTSVILNSSKLYRWRANGKGGYLNGTLYIASLNQENNVFNLLRKKIKSWLFNVEFEGAISCISATKLNLNNDSVDYIFTDPPFGSNLMYSELNLLNESWLGVATNNTMEAIENKTQNKSTRDYQWLMQLSFAEFYRVLKPGKWMTVEFSNTSAAVWNSIQTSIQNTGFVIANVTSLDKKQGSYNAVMNATSVKQDLVISCYKPSSEFDQKFKQHQNTGVAVWDFVEEHLKHLPIHLVKDNTTTAIIERSPKILFDRLIAFYVQKGLPVPIDAGAFQKGLRERFIYRDGMFFTNEQVQEYDKKKTENPGFIQLSILVSSEQDGVLWLKNLLTEKSLAYQDIQPLWMQALAGVRKGDVIPELTDILEENFLKDEHGKWYMPNPENEADLEKLRTKRLLKQFEVYKTEAAKPKGKIKEVRVEALRAGFKQAYQDKDFKTIVQIGDRIPNNLLMEDEVLLQFYDIASSRV